VPALSTAYCYFSAHTPSYDLTVDREKCLKLGVNISDVFSTMQAYMGSLFVNNFTLYNRTYHVVIQADTAYRADRQPRMGETILIAWNGSIEGVRAVQSLLDLLPGCAKVRVASVPEGHNDTAALELVRYLGWQGIEAQVAEVAKEGGTSQRLLQASAEQQAGLLVMGAYSHGRLRQMVLGGVTRDMTHHAGLPILLAH